MDSENKINGKRTTHMIFPKKKCMEQKSIKIMNFFFLLSFFSLLSCAIGVSSTPVANAFTFYCKGERDGKK